MSWGPRFLIPAVPYLAVLAVVALKDMAGKFRWKSLVVFVFLFLLGGIASIQGMLFNFLEFYSSFPFSVQEALSGTYNFPSDLFAHFCRLGEYIQSFLL